MGPGEKGPLETVYRKDLLIKEALCRKLSNEREQNLRKKSGGMLPGSSPGMM